MIPAHQFTCFTPLSDQTESGRTKLAEFLKQVSLFAGIDVVRLRRLAQDVRLRWFQPAEIVFHEGDPGDIIYFVKSGQIRLFVYSPDGNETSVMICGQPGAMFGELAVLDGLPRSATAVALRHTLLYGLSSQSFYQHMQECPRLALNFLNELSQRVRNNTRQMNHLASLGIPQRLAYTLLDLADNYGASEATGIRIDLSLTQDDLASLVGATRESVNKSLRAFRRRQWVHVQHKQIMILDRDALQAQAVG